MGMRWSPLWLLRTWRMQLCSKLLCSVLQKSVINHQNQVYVVLTSTLLLQLLLNELPAFHLWRVYWATRTTLNTEKECMQNCHTEDVEDPLSNTTLLNTTLLNLPNKFIFNATEVCKQRPKTGPCKAHNPRYFYNSSSMSCELFIYGGCKGNQNNFKTEKECMQNCHTEDVEDPLSNTTLLNTTLLNLPNKFIFNATKVCKQRPKTGPCKAHIPRYFYNSSSMSCELFIYGGCKGNQNNFKTEKECMQNCHTEEVCKQRPKTGPCKAHIPRYFYNSSSMSCELFIYGGCKGNQNNFKTEKECMQNCHTEDVEDPLSNTTLLNTTLLNLPNKFIFNATKVCKQRPKTGPCMAHIPRYFYNSSSMSCELFIYGGCKGNQNNFKTEKECMQNCHTEDVEDPLSNTTLLNTTLLNLPNKFIFNATKVCKQRPKTGPCKAHIPRYFYNSSSMSCELFIYGGCKGNQNNFKTEKECMQNCHTEEVCKQIPPTDGPTCLGNFPRYFYNSSSTSCQLFTYGGCGGNFNNFETEKECMQRCHTE
uniref:BPTI/Kunitz inhibitor domain-containing protein n=1 Tax=Sander lucioperca TaxID=283035 RepID=A0A8C9X8G6_SANLU